MAAPGGAAAKAAHAAPAQVPDAPAAEAPDPLREVASDFPRRFRWCVGGAIAGLTLAAVFALLVRELRSSTV